MSTRFRAALTSVGAWRAMPANLQRKNMTYHQHPRSAVTGRGTLVLLLVCSLTTFADAARA
ncbi:MAG: hypothetical protein M3R15_19065, partial [Acidobacteriota bacterium]|nr:hypothetical protein [Acidobacteriota bacterium]